MNIVFASHTHMGGAFVVGSHHLAAAFTSAGHRVAHVGAPLSLFHIKKWRDPETATRLRLWRSGGSDNNGVSNYVPMGILPWPLIRQLGIPTKTYSYCMPPIQGVLKQHGLEQVDILLMDEPRFFGLEQVLRPKTFIYRATDLYGAMRRDSSITALERQIVRQADALIGTSLPVIRHLESLGANRPVHLLENGVDLSLFSEPEKQPEPDRLRDIPRHRAIYVGAFDERFDFQSVTALAEALPQLHLVLIGPGESANFSVFKRFPNIHCMGALPYRDVPAWLAHCDLGLLPLSNHPANDGRSPMKIYEYGASGLPVVSKFSQELSRRSESFVHLYQNTDEMIKVTESLLAHPQALEASRQCGISAASSKGWPQIAEKIIQMVSSNA